ncbi:hypothetical protein CSW29_04810 [Thermus scotoductus]|uniref:DUF5723 domain-containing protein n=1 Tax=Thermus scotoductus TaxID=37636 RepID=A0A430UHV8_THESC|nr:hypothetical protein [Thermus scotoductus]RTI01094.1 hypothetical protein CSW29_04810 [Thermus scotoductus]
MRGKILLLSLAAGLTWASAQGVRQLGMGGVILPGPAAAGYNPAYALFPPEEGEGFPLPLGLLRLALPLFPETSPVTYFTDRKAFKEKFDLLSFYDQLSHPDAFLFNPARSPDEVVFTVRGDGITLTDGQGKPLVPDFWAGTGGKTSSLLPSPLLRLPLASEAGFRLGLGYLQGVDGVAVETSPELQEALKGNPSVCQQNPSPCALRGRGSFTAGLALDLAYATPLPEIPGAGRLHLGVRGLGFYGLAHLEAQAEARPVYQGDQISGTEYEVKSFLSYPGQGQGYGAMADLGLAWTYENLTLGLGVRNLLGFVRWSGQEEVYQNGQLISSTPAVRERAGLAPAAFLNGAYRLPLEEGSLLLAGDWALAEGSFHLGAEYAWSAFRLRAGFGREGGWRLGLGGGLRLPGLQLDAALTTHEAPLVGGLVYGLALSLGF